MIRFACGQCGQVIKVEAGHAGKKGKCPKCGQSVTVPARSTIIAFQCGNCGRKIEVPEVHAGKKGRCPKCREAVVVPAGQGESAERGGAATITCASCGRAVRLVEDSQDPFVECPGCGAFIEVASGVPAPESGASTPSDADEDFDDESPGPIGRPAGQDRRVIALVCAVAAVLLIGGVVLALALRSSGSRPAEMSEGPRGQPEVVATDLPPQPAAAGETPAEPIVQEVVSYDTAPERTIDPRPTTEAPGTIRLQFRPALGTKRTAQLTANLTMSVDEGGRQYSVKNTRYFEFALEVTESSGDGTTAIDVNLAAIREKSGMQGQILGEYDSAKPPGEDNPMAGIYAPFLRNHFTVKVSPRGEVVDPGLDELFLAAAERRARDEDDMLREQLREKADQAIRRADERFGSRENRVLALKQQLEQFPIFGREHVAGLLSNLVVALPDTPMRSGDTWEGLLTVDVGTRVQVAATYTLAAVEQGVCTVQAAGQRSMDEEPLVYEAGTTRVSNMLGGSSQATFQIERRTGWLLHKEHKTEFQGQTKRTTTGPPPQDTSAQVSMEITSTLTTLE